MAMKYFSMFSGIGGFELGIQNAYRSKNRGSQTNTQEDWHESETSKEISTTQRPISSSSTDRTDERPLCVGYSEIDKYAIKVYERHFKHDNYGNATTINAAELPDFDLLVGGFPCQAFSIAGKRAGFDDTRGTLFFDIARILAEKRPRHLVLENVKGLLSHDSGKTFQTILGVLSDLGYRVEWQVLNSKDFGVPQNRERVIIVGHLGGQPRRKVFPITGHSQQIASVAGYISEEVWPRRHEQIRQVYKTDGAMPTIPTGQGGGVMTKVAVDMTRRAAESHRVRKDGIMGTVTATYYKGIGNAERPGVKEGLRIRRLTPLECERLQGFPDDWTAGESDTQRYKMCGNAVTTNVIQAVITNLIECLN